MSQEYVLYTNLNVLSDVPSVVSIMLGAQPGDTIPIFFPAFLPEQSLGAEATPRSAGASHHCTQDCSPDLKCKDRIHIFNCLLQIALASSTNNSG